MPRATPLLAAANTSKHSTRQPALDMAHSGHGPPAAAGAAHGAHGVTKDTSARQWKSEGELHARLQARSGGSCGRAFAVGI